MSRYKFLGTLIDSLPTSTLLYRFCRRYVNRYSGENNSDMRRNGELRWLRDVLPTCSTIFDVGANVGDWTAMVLRINPNLQIHCFEPSAATFQILEARCLTGEDFLSQHGLSAASGEMTLHKFAEFAGTNSVYKRQGLNIIQTRT